MHRKTITILEIIILLFLAAIGWYVLLSQNPIILVLARIRYVHVLENKIDLTRGPCLGVIAPDWVLDIAHLPRQPIDNLPENQCPGLSAGIHHFVEMSPKGEVIVVQ